jgi:uncharacterized protein
MWKYIWVTLRAAVGARVELAGKHLLIASTESCSGKSAVLLGLADKLQQQGIEISYSKPLGNFYSDRSSTAEADIALVRDYLQLTANQVFTPLVAGDTAALVGRLSGEDQRDYRSLLQQQVATAPAGLLCFEGGSNLWEGHSYQLSVPTVAAAVDAAVLLVVRYRSLQSIDRLLAARLELGDRLLGAVINDVPTTDLPTVQDIAIPALEQAGIPILAVIPKNRTLRSVSVRELVHRLQAEVLCRPDRLDLLVESLSIGAMNVTAALDYFRRAHCMAVVTGGDREDIQLAALETSTQCLILTGHLAPQPYIIRRAEDLEIPIISVDFDTLTTVEIVEDCFAGARIQEAVQVEIIRQLMAEHFDFGRFGQLMGWAGVK